MSHTAPPASHNPHFQGPGPDAQYHAHLAAGEFRVQRCSNCGAYQFYPRVLCTSCGSKDLSFEAVSGEGTVYSHTTIHQKPERGGNYNLSLIELKEGPRLFSRVEGIVADAVKIGMPVRVRIVEGDEFPFVVFDPV